MSDRPAQRPAFCPFVYHDGVDLFLEFESGTVLRFAFTEGGISKAMRHIPNVTRQPGFLSGGRNIADKVIAVKRQTVTVSPRTVREREAKARAEKLSDQAKSRVRDIVRKMG